MTTPTSTPVYTQGYGTAFTGAVFVSPNAPASTNITGPNGPFKIGQIWVDSTTDVAYILVSITAFNGGLSAVWEAITASTATGFISSIRSNSGSIVARSDGSVGLSGNRNQISITAADPNDLTVSLTDGVSLGSYQATTPPTGGLLVPGVSSFGSSTPDARAFFTLNPTVTGKPWCINTTGTMVNDATQNNILVYFDNTIMQSLNGSNVCACFDSNTRFYVPDGQTVNLGACFYSAPFLDQNIGTLTNVTGYYAGVPFGNTGFITNGYGAYFNNPAVGLNNAALYADDICCGVLPNLTPTKGTFRSAPPNSNDALTAFGAITFRVEKQNTTGYDIIVTGNVNITSSTGSSVQLGVANSNGVLVNSITPALTITTPTLVAFTAYVPDQYWILISGDGVITVDSILSTVTPV